jgi:hypothetical protein
MQSTAEGKGGGVFWISSSETVSFLLSIIVLNRLMSGATYINLEQRRNYRAKGGPVRKPGQFWTFVSYFWPTGRFLWLWEL